MVKGVYYVLFFLKYLNCKKGINYYYKFFKSNVEY